MRHRLTTFSVPRRCMENRWVCSCSHKVLVVYVQGTLIVCGPVALAFSVKKHRLNVRLLVCNLLIVDVTAF